MKWTRMLTVGGCAMLMLAGVTLAQKGDGKERRRGRRGAMTGGDGAPKVGQLAPLFKLKSLDGKKETDLASFRAKKPVILFFGSYT